MKNFKKTGRPEKEEKDKKKLFHVALNKEQMAFLEAEMERRSLSTKAETFRQMLAEIIKKEKREVTN